MENQIMGVRKFIHIARMELTSLSEALTLISNQSDCPKHIREFAKNAVKDSIDRIETAMKGNNNGCND